MRRARLVVVLLLVSLGLAGPLAAAAGAGFVDTSSTSGMAVNTATLAPPTDLAAASSCVLLAPQVSLSWTATTSTFAAGYDVYRTASGGNVYSKIGTVTGRDITTYTDLTVARGGSYSYRVDAGHASWSTASGLVTISAPTQCL